MTRLGDLQDAFQRGILAGDDLILGAINDSGKECRAKLFGVYRNAYVVRLGEVLGEDYPKLRAFLGNAGFARLAAAYIRAHPSDRRSVRDFGRHVPDFLRTNPASANGQELVELAALEKALADAFDAADAPTLSLTELSQVDAEDWPRLAFLPQPGALRLDFATNAAEIWSALQQEAEAPAAELLSEPLAIVVWRHDLGARFRPLGPEEAMMWDEMALGTRFGVLCEMVATFGGEDGAELRAAAYVRNWVDTEMLRDFRVERGRTR